MSFADLDRSLSTPPRSPGSQGDRGPLSISRPSSNKSVAHGLTSPISPATLPSGLQVTRGNSKDSIGLSQHSNLQEQAKTHGPLIVHSSTSHGPYPPPVSPKRKTPTNVHSRILQDNTRIDTPRPSITSSSPTSAPFVQSGISSSSSSSSGPTSPTNNRVLGNQRPDDQNRRVLSPPTSPPQFSPLSSRNQFARNPQEVNTTNTRVTVERSILSSHSFSDSGASRPNDHETTPPRDNPSSSGITISSSMTLQDQDHDYDLMVRHLAQQIFNISSNVAVLERLVPCLGQRHKDTKEMRASLHSVLDTTQELVKSASTQVKLLARYHLPPSSNARNTSIISSSQHSLSAEASEPWQRKVLASRRMTHQRLTKDLALVSKAFQELQRQVVEAERRQVATLRRLSTSASLQRHSRRSDLMDLSQNDIEAGALLTGVIGEGGAPFSITVVPRTGRATSSSTGVLVHDRELSVQEEQLLQELLVMDGELAIQESILQERETEITRIEEGMGQVLEVMRELGVLVHEQRGGMDFLQDNILQTRGRIQLAQQEVLKASEYQRQSREKLCFMVLIASIVGAIVAFALM
ncbi:hypothetical protein CPC16_006690 [Podila verticillata]|nr:hypothetical protein CPC16_006690 [Podila verticillata]KFH67186.1 hypothetical protein MVEG_07709 [Podila verticillata NRRL 6337]